MVIHTASRFDRQLEEIDGEIKRTTAEIEQMQHTKQIKSHIKTAQKRLHQLLARKEEVLIESQSVANQIRQYRTDSRNRELELLREVEEFPELSGSNGSSKLNEALQQRLWNNMPNDQFTRGQQALSHVDDYRIPHPTKDRSGNFQLSRSYDSEKTSIRPVVISLEHFPEKIARDLLLVAEDKNLSKADRDRQRARGIPRLKKIWDDAELLRAGNQRILVIRADTNPDMSSDRVRGADPELHGTFLVTSELTTKKDNEKRFAKKPRLKIQHFKDAYSLRRKTSHQEMNYDHEIKRISKLIEALLSLNEELDREWSSVSSEKKVELREAAQKVFVECELELVYCKNKFKVKAETLIEKIHTNMSDQEKPNIGVVLTCMTTAKNDLNRRVAEIAEKGGENYQDKVFLDNTIITEETSLMSYRENILSMQKMIDQPNMILFNGSPSTPAMREASADGILSRIHPRKLKNIRMAPFVTFAEIFAMKTADLRDHLIHDRKAESQATNLSMHIIGKNLDILNTLDGLLSFIAEGRITASEILEMVESLQKHYNDFQLYPTMIIPKFVPFFEQMQLSVQHIIEVLQSLTPETEKNSLKHLKEFIQNMDVLSMVREMSKVEVTIETVS